MSSITDYRQLESWKEARILAVRIYEVAGRRPFSGDFGLRDQARRAAVSIMSNIAEGFARGGNAEFVHFLSIAMGSAAELESQLYLAADLGHTCTEESLELVARLRGVRSLLGGLVPHLKSCGMKGPRFMSAGGQGEPAGNREP